MLRKGKRLPVMVMMVLIIAFLGSLSGCGDSADPMGTGTIQFISETGEVLYPEEPGNPLVFIVMPGETRHLIVWVTNARDGGATKVPVIGEKVTFSLLTPGNGGSITIVNDETDGNGRAVGLYTAGNNFATDEVRVTTRVGAAAHVTIMKQGGIVGARISSLAASSTTVAAGQTSIITAMVHDGNGNPMQGEIVTFTLLVNESGASFVNASGVYVSSVSVNTDASGSAVAVYHGGSNSPDVNVYDTIRATLANGSTNSVTITRSTGTAVTALSITVAASPASVNAGQVSIVTATLTGDDNAGVTVTFTLPVNNSGATLSASSAVTDGAGNAQVTYQPGTTSPALDVSDTVRAAVGSISGTAAITRTGTAPLAYNLTISAAPVTLATNASNSVITANLKDTTGTAVSGESIGFTCSRGTLPGGTPKTTDGSGNAITTYTGDGVAGGTATVTATWGTYSNSVIITYP